jgi:hypothetical protein
MPLIDVVKRVIHCSFSYLRTQRAWRVEAPPPIRVSLRSCVLGLFEASFQL